MIPPDKKHPTETFSSGCANNEDRRESGVQGEGDYEAARRFNEAERRFVASGKVAAAAREAAPKSESERREMLAAEQQSKWRATEDDPALTNALPNAATSRRPANDASRKRR